MFLLPVFLSIACYHDDELCDNDFNSMFMEMSQRAERLEEELARAELKIAQLEDEQIENEDKNLQLKGQYTKLWFVAETFIAQSSERGEFLMVCPVDRVGGNETPRLAVVDRSQVSPDDSDCAFYPITYSKTGVPSLILN